MAEVDVQTEQNAPRGWLYHVRVERPDGSFSEHDVSLSWVDHDHWCGGRLAPSRVIEAVIRYLLEHLAQELPARFDAARARRLCPDLDRELRASL